MAVKCTFKVNHMRYGLELAHVQLVTGPVFPESLMPYALWRVCFNLRRSKHVGDHWYRAHAHRQSRDVGASEQPVKKRFTSALPVTWRGGLSQCFCHVRNRVGLSVVIHCTTEPRRRQVRSSWRFGWSQAPASSSMAEVTFRPLHTRAHLMTLDASIPNIGPGFADVGRAGDAIVGRVVPRLVRAQHA